MFTCPSIPIEQYSLVPKLDILSPFMNIVMGKSPIGDSFLVSTVYESEAGIKGSLQVQPRPKSQTANEYLISRDHYLSHELVPDELHSDVWKLSSEGVGDRLLCRLDR